ncbi:MAG: BNR repeat-containing protein [candidate division KSB1 bacterium]|nr:BNR repeat-containing protein [candidate division KSB1 bacterium]
MLCKLQSCNIPVLLLLLIATVMTCDSHKEPQILEQIDVDKVWAGHPVGFCLLTRNDHQFVAYYDANRQMTVAARGLGDSIWHYKHLPSTLGWDSHNYVTLAIDRDSCLHVSGNMHNDSLVYFRSQNPLDVATLDPIHRMTGDAETRVTYPRFMHDAQGNLLFMYRNGGSGNGERLVHRYSESTRRLERLLDTPLLDGRAHSMNAYPAPPVNGPDGYFHLVWMWRNNPDARSNHDISYMRSRDFVHWETAAGKPVSLPVMPDDKEVIVDPVPPNQGLINMGHKVSFDPDGRPVVIYHKYDENGYSQIFLARWKNKKWNIRALSPWMTRWSFRGTGAIECEIKAGPLVMLTDGRLVQSWTHSIQGSGTWELDPETLEVRGSVDLPPRYPVHLQKPESDIEGMTVRWCKDSGDQPSDNADYVMRWETLPVNRDQPANRSFPENSRLRVYQLKNTAQR